MKPTHGSEKITGGKLRGATDRTDYFYFFCPQCSGDEILRVLDFKSLREESGNKYNNQCRSQARKTFGLGFEIFCEKCDFRDYVKIANYGWQGGKHSEVLKP